MQAGDRLICIFISALRDGYVFKNWPVHITIIPSFRIATSSTQIAEGLNQTYKNNHQFTISVLEEAMFGYKKQKVVNLIDAPPIYVLEGQSRRFLHSRHAWIVDEADKTRNRYRPHITAQHTERAQMGDQFKCDRLYIVSQHGLYKRIDATIMLSNS